MAVEAPIVFAISGHRRHLLTGVRGSSVDGRWIKAANNAPSETVNSSTGLSKYALDAAETP
jgi:hypothetical protein